MPDGLVDGHFEIAEIDRLVKKSNAPRFMAVRILLMSP